jgi:hypothetical protein
MPPLIILLFACWPMQITHFANFFNNIPSSVVSVYWFWFLDLGHFIIWCRNVSLLGTPLMHLIWQLTTWHASIILFLAADQGYIFHRAALAFDDAICLHWRNLSLVRSNAPFWNFTSRCRQNRNAHEILSFDDLAHGVPVIICLITNGRHFITRTYFVI